MIIPVILYLASATFGTPAVVLPTEEVAAPQEQIESLGEYVEIYFSDAPVLADIAWCESHFRHHDEDGNVLRGTIDSDDIGVMQINTRYHLEDAEELGLDIFSLQGNLEYAKYLYDKKGTQPWNASRKCWGHLAQK